MGGAAAGVGFIPVQDLVVQQRPPRDVVVAEALGGLRQVVEGQGLDRPLLRRVLQHALRGLLVRRHQQRPPEQRQRLAAVVAPDRAFERLDRLAERHAIVACLRDFQPHTSQRDVGVWVIGIALRGAPERQHGVLGMPGARVGEAQRDLARRAGIEGAQRVELGQPAVGPAQGAIKIRQFLVRVQQRGLQLDRPLEGRPGRVEVLGVALAQPKEVVRLRRVIVDRQGALERVDGLDGMPVVVLRERELVQHAGRTVIQPDEVLKPVGGGAVAVRRIREVRVAQLLERAGRGRVDVRRPPEVPDRRHELPPAAVGLPALQIPDHRVVFEGNGTAEGLDGGARIVPGQGGIPVGDFLPVGPLALVQGVAIHPRGAQSEQK